MPRHAPRAARAQSLSDGYSGPRVHFENFVGAMRARRGLGTCRAFRVGLFEPRDHDPKRAAVSARRRRATPTSSRIISMREGALLASLRALVRASASPACRAVERG